MYELTGISLHNWYLIDALDIPLSGHTAIIGQTGAGKSSILDAIQTVISGNNKHIIELNAAAGETRGRTVKEYISGVISDFNDGKPKRENCEATIALKFLNKVSGKYITLGLMFTISEYEKSEKTKRFIINDYNFLIKNFIEDSIVMNHKKIIEKINSTHECLIFDNSGKYVQKYLEITRPLLTPDAKHFLKSFSNTLQAREISNPTLFVTKFLLEPSNIDIKAAKDSIKIWRDLNNEVNEIESKIENLKEISQYFRLGFQNELNSIMKKREERSQIISKSKAEEVKLLELLDNKKEVLKDAEIKKESLNSEIKKLSEHEKKIEKQNQAFSTLKHFLSFNEDNFNNTHNLEEYTTYRISEIQNKIENAKEKEVIINDFLINNAITRTNVGRDNIRITEQTKIFISELSKINIKSDLALNHITILEPDWQKAIENLLGINKEAILINKHEQKKATDILLNNKDRFYNIRIIKESKLIKSVDKTKSIIRFCSFTNSVVERFVTNLIGHYMTVNSFEEMQKIDYAVSMDSLISNRDFLRVLRNSPKQLKIDNKFIPQEIDNNVFEQIEQYKKEKDLLLKEISTLEETKKQYINILNNITIINENIAITKEIHTAETSLKNAENIKNEFEELVKIENQLKVDIMLTLKELDNIKSRYEAIKASEPNEEDRIIQLQDLLSKLIDEGNQSTKTEKQYSNGLQIANNKLLAYCQKWLETGLFDDKKKDEDRFTWVIDNLTFLENNQIIQYKEKLKEAYLEMSSIIKAGLILKLGDNFHYLDRQLESVNEKLSQHRFVGQKYVFKKYVKPEMKNIVSFIQKISENKENLILEDIENFDEIIEPILNENERIDQFEDYRNYFTYEMFVEYIDPQNNKTISSPFSEIMGKLSGGQRQAPYYVAIAASMVNKYFPKSNNKENNDGIGLLVFDEAFNKLDIPNTQKLMNLFADLNLQVVVAAPEEKRSSLIECVDSIINVNRIPSTDNIYIDPISIKQKAKDEMKKLNPILN